MFKRKILLNGDSAKAAFPRKCDVIDTVINLATVQYLLKNLLHEREQKSQKMSCQWPARDVTRTLIGGGGCLFIYSCSARRISFEFERIDKEKGVEQSDRF